MIHSSFTAVSGHPPSGPSWVTRPARASSSAFSARTENSSRSSLSMSERGAVHGFSRFGIDATVISDKAM